MNDHHRHHPIFIPFCSPPVRKASANVVSIVAKYAVPSGEWPELLPFLFQCSQSAQEDHREVSFTSSTLVLLLKFRTYNVGIFSM